MEAYRTLGIRAESFRAEFRYQLNFRGPAQIRESITLDRDHDKYSGTFTIDQYNAAGGLLQEVKGQVTGTRITVDTTID